MLLIQLIHLLKHVGIINVFLIDVSCSASVNFEENQRANRAMKYGEMLDLQENLRSGIPRGEIINVRFPTKSRMSEFTIGESSPDCIKCTNADACAVGSIGGVACCVGSCALGINPVIPSIATAATGALVTKTFLTKPNTESQQLKIKRNGGRKKTKKQGRKFLHLFSLKTPILERFHQRKVTLPCAFKMRKGVKTKKKHYKKHYKKRRTNTRVI